MNGPEVMQRALAKWRNAYAAQKQAEATHRAAVEQLERAEYELAVVCGVAAPPPPVAPSPYSPYAPQQYAPPPIAYPGPPVVPPAFVPPQVYPHAPVQQPPPEPVDTRPADEVVLEYMQKHGVGAAGGGG